jgi:hypothetical protein
MRRAEGMKNFDLPVTTPTPKESVLRAASQILEFPFVPLWHSIFGTYSSFAAVLLSNVFWAVGTYLSLSFLTGKTVKKIGHLNLQ